MDLFHPFSSQSGRWHWKKRLYCHQKRQTFYPVRLCLCLLCPASQDKVKWDKVSQSHQRQAVKQGTFKYLTCSNRLIVYSSLLQLWTSSPAIDPVRSLPHTPWRCRHVPCVAAVANQMNWCRYWIEHIECLKCDKTYFATKSLVGLFWSLRTLAHAQMQTCPRIFNPNIFLWVSFEGSKLLNLLKTSGADANCSTRIPTPRQRQVVLFSQQLPQSRSWIRSDSVDWVVLDILVLIDIHSFIDIWRYVANSCKFRVSPVTLL